MSDNGATYAGSFSLPPIVREQVRLHPEQYPEIARGVEAFCSEGETSSCSLTNLWEESAFCMFRRKVRDMEIDLNLLRSARVRWAGEAQAAWQARAEKLGPVSSVSALHIGDKVRIDIFIGVSHQGTQIYLMPSLIRENDGEILDLGFSVWFDSPEDAEGWLQSNLGRLPQIFSNCDSRLNIVDIEDNQHIDDLFHCWRRSPMSAGIRERDKGGAWQWIFHPMQRIGVMP